MRSLLVRRKILRLYLVSVAMLYARCDVPEDARNEYVLRTIASEHSSNVNSACTCYLHADVSLTANTRVFGDFANALSVSLLYYMPSKNSLRRLAKRAFPPCQTGFPGWRKGIFRGAEHTFLQRGTAFSALCIRLNRSAECTECRHKRHYRAFRTSLRCTAVSLSLICFVLIFYFRFCTITQNRKCVRHSACGTPTGNRTRIKGLGNLRSIHLTMGAAFQDAKLQFFRRITLKLHRHSFVRYFFM